MEYEMDGIQTPLEEDGEGSTRHNWIKWSLI